MLENEENWQEHLAENKEALPQNQIQSRKKLGFNLRKSISAGTKPQPGQAIVEYALLIALIALVAIGILVLLGPTVTSVFNNVTGTVAGNCGDTSFTPGQNTPTPMACNINCYPAPGSIPTPTPTPTNTPTRTPTPKPGTPTATPSNTPTPKPPSC